MNRFLIGLFTTVLFPVVANAAFTVTTNTETELTGSFSALSFSENLRVRGTPFEGLLPGDLFSQSIGTFVLVSSVDNPKRAGFQTTVDGTPDNPEVICFESQACEDLFGSYNNNVTGTSVNFAITNLAFSAGTGNNDAVFTGNFSFTATPVPLPAAAWFFASALVGLTLIQRRK